jgi:large subunit ribosomal protein L3
MITWIIWKKLGMSQIFDENWNVIPVTYVAIEENEIIQLKTEEKDWYNAIVVWADPYKNPSKNQKFKKLKEFKTSSLEWLKIWAKISVDSFKEETLLHITWISKWRWFSWQVKRWWRSIARKTHWTKYIRHGSTMNNAITWRSRKWIKMAWHYWTDTITLKNRKVCLVDTNKKVIAIKWAIPWFNWSFITISKI